MEFSLGVGLRSLEAKDGAYSGYSRGNARLVGVCGVGLVTVLTTFEFVPNTFCTMNTAAAVWQVGKPV